MFDVTAIRNDFPILAQKVKGKTLSYLDNAATMQMPASVQGKVVEHYQRFNANVHRGTHYLSHESTKAYEEARCTVASFLNAEKPENVVFSTGTTGAINIVARGLEGTLSEGDSVVVTVLEHHSNYVPWQQVCKRTGAEFRVVGVTDAGDLDIEALSKAVDDTTKVVAATCCSNVLGTVTPVGEIVQIAHEKGALCLLDAAQGIRHGVMDVQEVGCDYLAFSGHKVGGPTGIGVLYGTEAALDLLDPCWYGGEMVDVVTQEATTWEALPLRLEPGTPNYVGAIGLAAALDYLESIGRSEAAAYEDELVAYAEKKLSSVEGIQIMGSPFRRSGCISFVVDGVHAFDLCTLIDKMGVALRSGNACAQPLLATLGVTSVARLSPAFYNTYEEIDVAVQAIKDACALLSKYR